MPLLLLASLCPRLSLRDPSQPSFLQGALPGLPSSPPPVLTSVPLFCVSPPRGPAPEMTAFAQQVCPAPLTQCRGHWPYWWPVPPGSESPWALTGSLRSSFEAAGKRRRGYGTGSFTEERFQSRKVTHCPPPNQAPKKAFHVVNDFIREIFKAATRLAQICQSICVLSINIHHKMAQRVQGVLWHCHFSFRRTQPNHGFCI